MTRKNIVVFSDNEEKIRRHFREWSKAGYSLRFSDSTDIKEKLRYPGSAHVALVDINHGGISDPALPPESPVPLFLITENWEQSGNPGTGNRDYPCVSFPLSPNVFRVLLDKEIDRRKLRNRLAKIQRRYAEEAKYREILTDIVQTANSSLEAEVVIETIMNKIKNLIKAEGWSLLLLNEDKNELIFKRAEGRKGRLLENQHIQVGVGIAGWVAKTGEPLIVNKAPKDPRFLPDIDKYCKFKTESVLCAPLISRGNIIGVVEVINKDDPRGFTNDDQAILMTLVEPAAIALENALLFQKSKYLSVTDDLTKLYNSRYFNDALNKEVERARRYDGAVSLIFLDLDNFKSVNDTHGHLAGSRTIFETARIIRQEIREVDIASRYGGDEFTVILPSTDTDGGLKVAERIRRGIEKAVFLRDMDLEVTITASLGLACYPENADSKETLIHKADTAMYYVKDHNKNGIHVYE